MSFGFGVGDFLASLRLVNKVVQAYRDKGGPIAKFAAEAQYLSSVETIFTRLQEYSRPPAPGQHVTQSQRQRQQYFAGLVGGMAQPLNELRAFVNKYAPALQQAATANNASTLAAMWGKITMPLHDILGKTAEIRKQIDYQLQLLNTGLLFYALDEIQNPNRNLTPQDVSNIRQLAATARVDTQMREQLQSLQALALGGQRSQKEMHDKLQSITAMRHTLEANDARIQAQIRQTAAQQERQANHRHQTSMAAVHAVAQQQNASTKSLGQASAQQHNVQMVAMGKVNASVDQNRKQIDDLTRKIDTLKMQRHSGNENVKTVLSGEIAKLEKRLVDARRAEAHHQQAAVSGQKSQPNPQRASVPGQKSQSNPQRASVPGQKSQSNPQRASVPGQKSQPSHQQAPGSGQRPQPSHHVYQSSSHTSSTVYVQPSQPSPSYHPSSTYHNQYNNNQSVNHSSGNGAGMGVAAAAAVGVGAGVGYYVYTANEGDQDDGGNGYSNEPDSGFFSSGGNEGGNDDSYASGGNTDYGYAGYNNDGNYPPSSDPVGYDSGYNASSDAYNDQTNAAYNQDGGGQYGQNAGGFYQDNAGYGQSGGESKDADDCCGDCGCDGCGCGESSCDCCNDCGWLESIFCCGTGDDDGCCNDCGCGGCCCDDEPDRA